MLRIGIKVYLLSTFIHLVDQQSILSVHYCQALVYKRNTDKFRPYSELCRLKYIESKLPQDCKQWCLNSLWIGKMEYLVFENLERIEITFNSGGSEVQGRGLMGLHLVRAFLLCKPWQKVKVCVYVCERQREMGGLNSVCQELTVVKTNTKLH